MGGHRIALLLTTEKPDRASLGPYGHFPSVPSLITRKGPHRYSPVPFPHFAQGRKTCETVDFALSEGWSPLPSHHGFTVRYGSLFFLRPTRFRTTPDTLAYWLSHLNGVIGGSRTFPCESPYVPVARKTPDICRRFSQSLSIGPPSPRVFSPTTRAGSAFGRRREWSDRFRG